MTPAGDGLLAYDPQTLDYYQKGAATYGAHREAIEFPALMNFIQRLPRKAFVLELGCGGGQDAEVLLRAGLEVTVTDGCPAMADIAARRLRRQVGVLRFDELDDVAAFDGIWANACLLHAPEQALPELVARIHRALKPSGVFCATFKGGTAGARDALGRYFNYMSADALEVLFRRSAPWSEVEIERYDGRDFLGTPTQWLIVRTRA